MFVCIFVLVSLRKSRRPDNLSILVPHRRNDPTATARPLCLVSRKLLHHLLHLGSQIRTNKSLLPHDFPAPSTIPAHCVQRAHAPRHFHHHANRVTEPDGTMGRVGGEEEHGSFMDGDVLDGVRGGGRVDYRAEENRSSILVEEFGCGVDVVVCSRVGPTNYHNGIAGREARGGVVYAIIIHGGLEKMRVFFEPLGMERERAPGGFGG